MVLSVGRYHSFVVRILSHDGRAVQGQITHVATRESVRFRDADRMIEFILQHVTVPAEGTLDEVADKELS